MLGDALLFFFFLFSYRMETLTPQVKRSRGPVLGFPRRKKNCGMNSRFGRLIPTDDLEGRKLGIEIKEKTGLGAFDSSFGEGTG